MNKQNVLLLVDFQKEYNTKNRSYYIHNIKSSLENAQKILYHARIKGWPIIHVKHYNQSSNFFIEKSPYSDYIENFKPITNEFEFIKNNFSCFSSNEFTAKIKEYNCANINIIGYNSRMCILSTIIEGYHKGYNINFIHDASNAKATAIYSEKEIHNVMTSVLSTFANIISTEHLLNSN